MTLHRFARSLLLAVALASGGAPSCEPSEGGDAAEANGRAGAPATESAPLGIPPDAFSVDVERTAELLADPPGEAPVVLLDVRTPGEIREGHVAGAEFLDSSDPGFREHLDRLDRDRAYLVFCRSGMRSARTVVAMREKGFPAVWNVDGGILAWRRAGLPLVVPEPGK
jgi:rhodanese-related sulfurtransferase